MMKPIWRLALLFALASPSAWSQDIVDHADPQRVLEAAKGFGSATLTQDEDGYPLVRGRMDGLRYRILFYVCEERVDCDVIQFRVSWDDPGLSVAEVNAWNESKLFGKAYLLSNGDLFVEHVVNLGAGVTAENLDDTFAWFSAILESVTEDLLPPLATSEKG